MKRIEMKRIAAVVIVCAALSACVSPEATRRRGGGLGADVNNRPAQVKMHEGSRLYWKTPVRIRVQGPPLDASEQARELTLRGASNK
jgi:hypothetical protein